MNRAIRHVLLVGTAFAVIGMGLSGCHSTSSQTSKEDVASFKGGPMPPEARKKMQDAIDAAHNKAAQSAQSHPQ